MPTLLECIKKTGKLLSPDDKQFLTDQIESGASDSEALDAFMGTKTGRAFEDFFAGVTSGEFGKPSISSDYNPVVPSVANQLNTPDSELYNYHVEYDKHRGDFDQHIALSIPGYRDFQYQIGNAIVNTFDDGTMLDIGASEGTQAKTITSLSDGKIETISLDPNKSMQRSFNKTSKVSGATFDLSAFGMTASTEGDIAWDDIPYFDPKGQKFDIVQESMVFQFIDNNRDVHIKRVAELTKDDGIAIFQEKLHNPDWDRNEKLKNEYKSKSFAKEDMDAKATEVLEGMNKNMVSVDEIERQLKKNFKYVEKIWDSGNFKGYAASNNESVLAEFVSNMGDTTSPFDTNARIDELNKLEDTDGIVNGELIRPPIVDGKITLTHFSKKASLTSIDPAYYGEGYAGAEKKRRYDEAWINRSYYGIAPEQSGGYVKERGVGNNRFEVTVPASLIYDFAADPKGLRSGKTASEYEKAIHDAGYAGYWVKDPQLGMTSALFERVVIDKTLSQSSVALRRGKENLKKYGLDPNKRYTTREVAAAMETRTRDKSGVIARDDRSPEAVRKIARWIVQEVKFEMENPEFSGVGWYSEKFQEALDVVGNTFPELLTDQGARDTFTAIIAITSDGQKVGENFEQAYGVYKNYRETGEFVTDRKNVRSGSVEGNLLQLQQLIDEMGVEKTHEYLIQEKTVRELKKIAKDRGLKFSSDYPVDVKIPMAAVLFGPKLGAFYGNLMGEHGYLTMDRWWSRTINRYRGTLLKKPTRAGLDRFKQLMNDPDMTDDEVLIAVIDPAQAYGDRDFKTRLEMKLNRKKGKGKADAKEWEKIGESHPDLYAEDVIERAANTIYKAAYTDLEDAPFNGSDRKFMIAAVNHARKSLAKSGHKFTVADIQATLWYYEKRLYHEMGTAMTMDVSYQDAAQNVVDKNEPGDYLELMQSGETNTQGRILFQTSSDRNEIGLYSSLEKSVLEMKLPQWKKPDGKADGKSIWAKLSKEAVKKEELEVVGIEEFLMGADEKLTRDDVAAFIRQNGVKVVEVVGDQSEDDAVIYWSMPEILTDESEIDARTDQIIEDEGGTWRDTRERVISEYEDDPIWFTEANVNGVKLFIAGNNDMGYDVIRDDAIDGEVVVPGVSSQNEAEIQAADWAREENLISTDDTKIAKWGNYIMGGESSNYREIKLTLPELEDDYYNDVHFPDRNLVAFLRVDDRDLSGDKFEPVNYFVKDGQIVKSVKSKTYFVDEMQSDWHQAGRQRGYKTGESLEDLGYEYSDTNHEVGVVLKKMFNAAKNREEVTESDVNFFEVNGETISRSLFSRYAKALVRGTMNETSLAASDVKFVQSVIDDTDADTVDELRSMLADMSEINRRLDIESRGVPDAPFKNDAWMTLALRRAIVNAVDNGYDSIAWPNSMVLMERWSYEYATLYKTQYDRKMPSIIKKITREKPQQFTTTGEPYGEPVGSNMSVKPIEGTRTWQVVDKNGEPIKDLGSFSEKAFAEEFAHEGAPEGYWMIPITDELKNRIKPQGLPLFQRERGRIYMNDNSRIIKLTEASDLSTFLHESAHLFLDMERFYAKKYGVSEDQKAIMEWLGVDSLEDITTEMHEKWAETFEVYLREGKSPSLKLRRAFAAFSRWLKRIYQSLKDGRLTRAKLDPEITEIFDRMLATEAEIAEAAANPEYDQFFKSKEQSGMSDAQWGEYQARAARVKDTAERTLDEKVLAQYMKARTDEWNEEKSPIVEEERERISQLPIYEIMSDLRVIKDTDTGEVIAEGRFDTTALRELFPDGKIPGRFIGKHIKEGGMDPALYAEQYGFSSAKAMIDTMVNAPTLKQAAEEAAEAKMVEKYGDILNDGSLEQEVREALINDDHAAMLMMEINANRGRKSGINREYLKAQAATIVGTMKYSEIKPNKYYRAMVKAAKKSMTEKDPLESKIQELSNHYLYKEAIRVREQMEKNRRFVKAAKSRKYDTKKVDDMYVQQIKMLSEMYDFRNSPEQMVKLENILNFYSAQMSEVGGELTDLSLLDINLVRALEYRIEHGGNLAGFQLIQFDEMTANDLQGVVDMLKHLRYVGGQIAEINGEEVILERMQLVESVRSEGGHDYRLQRGHQRQGESARRGWNHLVNTMPSLANMIRKLDGFKDGGTAFQSIYTLLSDALGTKFEMNKKFYDQFEELMGDVSKVELSRMDGKKYNLDSGEVEKFTSEEAFMMALYWGTTSSREAIMESWGLSENDVMSIMSRLSEDQLNLVNTVWKMNEAQWPDLRDASIEMLGVAPPKLEAQKFVVNGVEMTGGHMQLFYDSQKVELGNEQESARRTSSMQPNTAGSANARVGSGGQPVKLDIGNISRSVDDKIHYIAFARAGRKLRQLINHKDVKAVIERKHGPGFYQAFVESIEGVTAGRLAQETHAGWAKISRWMRQSATMMHLGYSIRNTAQQFGAIPIASRAVGNINYANASIRFLQQRKELVALVNSKSKFMENRAQVVNRESSEFMKQLISTSEYGYKWNKFKSHAFMFQTAVDSTVAYPTWLAAYENSMESHGDEKRARIEADTAVAESVGSGADIHLGRTFQGSQNEFVKSLTVFGSWFNAYYQRLYKSSKGGTDFFNKDMFLDAVFLPFIVANISQVLIMDMPDDDEEIGEYMFKNTFMFLSGVLPLVRTVGSFIEGFTPSAPVNQLPASSVRAFREVVAYLEGRQTGLKTFSDVGKTATALVPVPGSGEIWRSIDYVDSFLQDREGSIFNPYQMLVEGADKDR